MSNISVQRKDRISNFELLRILSMFIILLHHFTLYSGFDYDGNFTLSRATLDIISIGGKLGSNCFILISGYFLCTQTRFNFKSIAKLLLNLTLYSVITYTAIALLGFREFSFVELAKASLPLFWRWYWFINVYIMLIMLSPFLARIIKNLSQRDHIFIVMLLTFTWSILRTFTGFNLECNDLAWCIFLYFVAAYIRKYPIARISPKLWGVILVLSLICMSASAVIFDYLNKYHTVFGSNRLFFAKMERLPCFTASISLFMLFKNSKPFVSKTVNTASAAMLGVYLLHENIYFRDILWKSIFKSVQYQNSPLFFICVISIPSLAFILCTFICCIYNKITHKPLEIILDKCGNILQTPFNKLKHKALSFFDAE